MEPNIKTTEEFNEALAAGPGLYPLYFLCQDSGALCFKCAKENKDLILSAIQNKDDKQWQVIHVEINYEDKNLICQRCYKAIESAY